MVAERDGAATANGLDVERRGEARLPAFCVTLVAAALYAFLPQKLILGPRLVIPALEMALLVTILLANPSRTTERSRRSRTLSLALITLIGFANAFALVVLLHELVQASKANGLSLLIAAGQVWLTNVITFGLAFWELDRGGPIARLRQPRDELPAAEFRFTQDEDEDTVTEVQKGSSPRSGWVPTLPDYLYVSLTNSSAFSPTDTMPLSTRAKLLMGLEATMALVTSIVVIAKGVGGLGG